MGFNHGTFEAYTTGACRCEVCGAAALEYCNPQGVPMCNRLPGHAGKHTIQYKDRVLDMLERELFALNFSSMHRTYIRDIVRRYQS